MDKRGAQAGTKSDITKYRPAPCPLGRAGKNYSPFIMVIISKKKTVDQTSALRAGLVKIADVSHC
jgi:hypothetical protein